MVNETRNQRVDEKLVRQIMAYVQNKDLSLRTFSDKVQFLYDNWKSQDYNYLPADSPMLPEVNK